jgi:polyhydroxyalkanoate synthesis regulator phasin
VFSTATENQKAIEIKLLIGESPIALKNLLIGTFHLKGLPPAGRGVPQITVTFSIDDTCAVTARATLQGSDLSSEQKFDPPENLSEESISKIIASAEKDRSTDEATLRRIESKNRADDLIAKAEKSLKEKADSQLSAAIANLGLALESKDADKIREKSDALERQLSPFASGNIFEQYFSIYGSPKPSPNKTETPAKRKAPAKQDLASSSRSYVLGSIFGGATFTLDPQLCFVLMPFAEKFQPIYDDHIRPTVTRAGLRCERADEIRGPTLITWDIWERVNRARFLIAELTDQNSNVFYELGLAHAISKDVILITQSMDFVPFDLKALRCICYEFTPRGTQQLEKELFGTIQTLMKAG